MGERENQDTFEKEGSKAVRSSNKRNAAQQFQVVTRKLDAIEEAVKAVGRNRSGWANRTDDWDGQEAGYGWGLGKREEKARWPVEQGATTLEPAPAYSRDPA